MLWFRTVRTFSLVGTFAEEFFYVDFALGRRPKDFDCAAEVAQVINVAICVSRLEQIDAVVNSLNKLGGFNRVVVLPRHLIELVLLVSTVRELHGFSSLAQLRLEILNRPSF